jgi:hypothetical protein
METLLIYGSLENPISKSTSKSYSKIIGFATKEQNILHHR